MPILRSRLLSCHPLLVLALLVQRWENTVVARPANLNEHFHSVVDMLITEILWAEEEVSAEGNRCKLGQKLLEVPGRCARKTRCL